MDFKHMKKQHVKKAEHWSEEVKMNVRILLLLSSLARVTDDILSTIESTLDFIQLLKVPSTDQWRKATECG